MRAMLKSKEDGTKTPSTEAEGNGQAAGLWYQGNAPDAPRSAQVVFDESSGKEQESAGLAQSRQQDAPKLWPTSFQNMPHEGRGDVIDRKLLSVATARQLFETYKEDLFQHYPMVPVPASISADEMRATKPTLFLAIIAAASAKEDSDLSALLDKEVLQQYATRSLMRSEKSLELVQALLISAVWYNPPGKFGQLKYYEYIHMAATMAMDLGIGTRPMQHRSRLNNVSRGREPAAQAMLHPAEDVSNPDLSMTPRSRPSSPDTGNTQSRRTFLACYAICAGVSLSLRRPNMLRVSSYVRECVDYLERAPDAIPSDRTVVAWVRLIMIAEEISVSFSFDDPGGIASISELRTQMMLKDFEKRLTQWYASVPEADINPSGMIMYYTIRLFLHEIALHVDHSPEDFRAPYQMGIIHPSDGEEVPTQVLAESIAECITSSHALLSVFISMDVSKCRALPVFSWVRISFAAFVLAKLCLSAAHPGSRIGKVLDRSSLKVEDFMDRAILHVRNIVGPYRSRIPAIFLALLFKLRQWCLHPYTIKPASEISSRDPDLGACMPGRAVISIEGSRITEHVSSNESSPQGQIRDGHTAHRYISADGTLENTSYHLVGDLTPDSTTAKDAGEDGTATDLPGLTSGSITIPRLDDTEMEQMQLDYSFFDTLGDAGGFPEGGLAGLDDWMPNNLTNLESMPGSFGWPSTPGPSGYT